MESVVGQFDIIETFFEEQGVPADSTVRTAWNELRQHVERQREESRRLAEAQADAIVHAAEIISELEETRQRLEEARARAEAAAQEARRLSAFGDILEQSLAEIYIVDQQSLALIHVNRGACENIGYSLTQLRQMTLADINGELGLSDLRQILAPLMEGLQDSIELTTVHRRQDASEYPVRVHLEASRFDERPVFSVTALDITEQSQMLHRLHELAYVDPLTKLPNRVRALDVVQQFLDEASSRHVAVLFLDFDRFKLINDSLGHDVGDELLKEVARRIRTVLRQDDRVVPARLGGDEFVVVLRCLSRPGDAATVADRLVRELSGKYELGPHTVYSSVSIGVVTSEHGYQSASDMLRDADLAMYAAKQAGKSRYAVFDEAMRSDVQRRLNIEGELRRAIEDGELQLFYQPIVALDSQRLHSVEALIRWQHPSRGIISPSEFISVAEETGLITSIGEWAIDEALNQYIEWQQILGEGTPSVHVNVSRRQLLSLSFVDYVKDRLQCRAVPPHVLHLEVTESMIMHDQQTALGVLNELRELGVKVAMDDFGTGHSSLSCLHAFPIDVLKIDRSFIATPKKIYEFVALLHAVLTLADNLGLEVITEGIEDIEQLATLQALGCKYGQGYLFSKPLRPDDLVAFVHKHYSKEPANVSRLTNMAPTLDLANVTWTDLTRGTGDAKHCQ